MNHTRAVTVNGIFILAIATTCLVSPATAEDAEVVKLWPKTMPGPMTEVNDPEVDRQKPTDRLIGEKTVMKLTNTPQPEIHVYLPPAEKANGGACVICPGGGFSILAWDLEGTEVAEWLNSVGVAGVILKYRTPTRQLGMPDMWRGPVMDTQRALSLARANAEKWRIDPKRVGVLGFSAGGKTASMAAVLQGERLYEPTDAADEASCAADYAVLIYPGGIVDDDDQLREEYKVDAKTPPTFFAHAADDRVSCLHSTALFTAMKKAGAPAELHVFGSGGHGFGLRPTTDAVTHWPKLAEQWLRELEML